jgi:DNA-binding beta-propeller fold protein YncE
MYLLGRCRELVVPLGIILVLSLLGCSGSGDKAGPRTGTSSVRSAEAVSLAQSGLLGDLDGDGAASVGDAIRVLRIVVGLDPDDECADANENGSTDVGDAIKVLRCVVGLDDWPIGECGGPIEGGYEFVTAWGSHGGGNGDFDWPADAAIDDTGSVYVADAGNALIQVFAPDGTFLRQWGDGYGTDDGEFMVPNSLAIDTAGNVFVVEREGQRVQKFTDNGDFVAKWGSQGSGDGQFNEPKGTAVDQSGNVYVADMLNHRIQKFTGGGTFITKWGSHGVGNGQFDRPAAVAVDGAGNVYVADGLNNRIQKFSSNGAFISKWGAQCPDCVDPRTAVAAQLLTGPKPQSAGDGFCFPCGIAVDAAGDVYVSDTYLYRIQKFTSTGTPICKWGSRGTANGQFDIPMGLAVDASGNVYVADAEENDRIQKFRPVTP